MGPFIVNHMLSYGIGLNVIALIYFIPTIMGNLFQLSHHLVVIFTLLTPKIINYYNKEFSFDLGILACIIGYLIAMPIWGKGSHIEPPIIGLPLLGVEGPLMFISSIPLFKENL